MKKLLFIASAVAALIIGAASCEKEEQTAGLSLNKTEISLAVGETFILEATLKTEDILYIKFASGNPAVCSASLVQGTTTAKITARAAGEATVTVTAGEYTATCKVTVEEKPIPLTGIELSESELFLSVGDVQTITAKLLPANTTEKPEIKWESDKTSVATVEGGKITAVADGTAKISASAGSFKAECTVTVEKYVAPVRGKVIKMNSTYFPYTWPDEHSVLNDVSIECWINTAGSAGNQSIVGIEGVFLIRTESNQFELIYGGDKRSGSNEYNEMKIAASYNGYLNKWTHLAATYSKNGTVCLYVDGQKKDDAIAKDHGIDMNGVGAQWGLPFTFYIGNAASGDRYINGNIAYVRVWKKALSASEIAANMKKADIKDSDLIANWKFDEGQGNSIKDATNNGRTLTPMHWEGGSNGSASESEIEWVDGELPF